MCSLTYYMCAGIGCVYKRTRKSVAPVRGRTWDTSARSQAVEQRRRTGATSSWCSSPCCFLTLFSSQSESEREREREGESLFL